MFTKLREPFGTAGLVVAIVALIAALAGGAYAAGGSGSHATASAKAKQGKPGKNGKNGTNGTNGAPGATGPAGPAGPAGAAGKDGTNGEKGEKGDTGTKGSNGTSVVSSTETPGANCENGGSKFVAGASTTYACNGKNGETGFTATLPSGKTETGYASFTGTLGSLGEAYVPVSFPIPLEEPGFIPGHVLSPTESETTECPGTFLEPKAAPGNFCLYEQTAETVEAVLPNVTLPLSEASVGHVANFGGSLIIIAPEGSPPTTILIASWAVTAN